MSGDHISQPEMLDRFRRRKPIFAVIDLEASTGIGQIDVEFRAMRRKRSDIGITNHLLNLFLEPRNPFEPSRRRKPKMEAVVFGALFGLVVIAVLTFTLAFPKL